MIACVYAITAIYTFGEGVTAFFQKKQNLVMYVIAYTPILPIAAMVFDFDSRRVYKRAEFKKNLISKIVAWIIFYIVYIMAAIIKKPGLFGVANLFLIIFPCLCCFYSYVMNRYPQMLTYTLGSE
jgi:hypothetical protein